MGEPANEQQAVCTHPDGTDILSPIFGTGMEGNRQLRAWVAEREREGCSCFGTYGLPSPALEAIKASISKGA